MNWKITVSVQGSICNAFKKTHVLANCKVKWRRKPPYELSMNLCS